ncbi:hypothetical protein CYMTET_32823 [Cymbomonas tetramitiformis]|uniref:Uncharacterized protein n=1 Tax=Cymbomonas tetramitiformis TaxID=36881 RepID=A0AAE0FEW4_9CHLO|nr:hypothetical protein CYMTET_32823 [Cymbomonas tetramitiformis]
MDILEEGLDTASGEAINVSYLALDLYNGLATMSETVGVVVYADEGLVGGTTRSAYSPNIGALFEELSLSGTPGESFLLQFVPSDDTWSNVELEVRLAPCSEGERYNSDAQRCVQCPEGEIKFDNSTSECAVCAGTGITCLGGNNYTLDDGYWIATGSVNKCVAAGGDSTACLFSRIYECVDPLLCQADAPRINSGGSPTLEDSLLCRAGANAGIVLCGACEAGHYYRAQESACKQCPDQGPAVLLQVIGLCGCLLLMGLLVRGVVHNMRSNMVTQEMVAEFSDFVCESDSARMEAPAVFSIWCGWMQVAGQTMDIFDADVIPELYQGFLRVTEVFNFRILDFFGVPCMLAALLDDPSLTDSMGGYLPNFLFFAFLPFLIAAPTTLMIYWYLDVLLVDPLSLNDDALEGDADNEQAEAVKADQPPNNGNIPHPSASRSSDLRPEYNLTTISTNGLSIEVYDERHIGLEADDSSCHNIIPERASLKLDATPTSVASHDGPPRRRRRGMMARNTVLDRLSSLIPPEVRLVYLPLSVFLLVLLHPVVSTYMFNIFACDEIHRDITEPSFWLRQDYSLQCFRGHWWIYAAIATWVIVIYIAGLPICIFYIVWKLYNQKRVKCRGIIMYCPAWTLECDGGKWEFCRLGQKRMPVEPQFITPGEMTGVHDISSKLDLPESISIFGIIYRPFKGGLHWFASFDIAQKLAQSAVVILVRLVDRKFDVFYALVIAFTSLMVQAYYTPYVRYEDNMLRLMVLYNQCLVITSFIAQEYMLDGNAERSVVGATLLVIQILLSTLILVELFKTVLYSSVKRGISSASSNAHNYLHRITRKWKM